MALLRGTGGASIPRKHSSCSNIYSPSRDPVEEHILTTKITNFHNFYVGLAPENDEVDISEEEEGDKNTFDEESKATTSDEGPSFKMIRECLK